MHFQQTSRLNNRGRRWTRFSVIRTSGCSLRSTIRSSRQLLAVEAGAAVVGSGSQQAIVDFVVALLRRIEDAERAAVAAPIGVSRRKEALPHQDAVEEGGERSARAAEADEAAKSPSSVRTLKPAIPAATA
jgi:hypothetical protein